jgi:membrane protease YdiL (CAAX protease family)
MPADLTTAVAAPARRPFIAPAWHTLSLLLILGFFGWYDAQHAQNAGSSTAAATHGAVLRGDLLPILYEWGLAAWAWGGVRLKGGNLRALTGGRWMDWRTLLQDVAIAIPFWGVWELTARLVHYAVERVQAPTTAYHPPAGFAEVLLWILLSVSAGVCEEIIYRGYFQQQFRAATRSVVAAVILQALVFGLVHAYQGWKQVLMIAPLGILYGALVAWRRNLRASMIAHTLSDIFEGWLKFL